MVHEVDVFILVQHVHELHHVPCGSDIHRHGAQWETLQFGALCFHAEFVQLVLDITEAGEGCQNNEALIIMDHILRAGFYALHLELIRITSFESCRLYNEFSLPFEYMRK